MIIIASNMTTRSRKFANILDKFTDAGFEKEGALSVVSLAKECVAAGAGILDINLQDRYDTPAMMVKVVNAVQSGCDYQLCLSCRKPDTLEAGLRVCQRPPLVNYVSLDAGRLDSFLPLAAQYRTELVLMTADPVPHPTLEENLKSAAILVGTANEAGIPNNRILIDPGVFHISHSVGQQHCRTLMQLVPAIREAFDPEIRTTCWVNNISAGASRNTRPFINSAFLAVLSGLGLSSAFMDVLDPQIARMSRLLRIFRNELIYSEAELDHRP